MKSGLIAFGIIFLVLGGLLYYYPSQTVGAQKSGVEGVTTSSATASIPVEWSYAFLICGALLLFFGLIIPSSKAAPGVPGPMGPRGSQGRRAVRRPARRRAKALPRGTTVRTTKTTIRSRR